VLRRVFGSLLVIFGGVTAVLAVAASVWVHLTVNPGQFDVPALLLVGGAVAISVGAVLAVGLFLLVRKPDARASDVDGRGEGGQG
jgi:hypothetical protein